MGLPMRTDGSALLALLMVVGCGSGANPQRVGPAVPLSSGQAATSCERDEWYELAPSIVEGTAVRSVGYVQVHRVQEQQGLAVYQLGDEDVTKLDDLWARMNEPELQRAHEARIQPVSDARARSAYWLIGGLVGLGAGVGIAAAIQDESKTGAAVAGLTGLGIGLVGVIVSLANMPSTNAEIKASTRRYLFIPGEDDLAAAARGIDRVNQSRRFQCESTAAPP
jgi:hypothetical protein